MTTRYYLAKTDPETYSIEQFEKDGHTVWDGVRNAQALRAIRAMHPGIRCSFTTAWPDAAVVGLAKLYPAPRPDPKDPKLAVVELAVCDRVSNLPPPCERSRRAHEFDDWALVRQSRLSTMEAPPNFVQWMREKYPKLHI